MEVYLVGGAVRDELLGLPIHERDYVVVGSTPAAMIANGYQQVGKDFPVFLHPKTQEEYALARTERKAGKGYTGFECFADPSITLEQDLERRDLTINAIAKSAAGHLIDPFHGLDDLANKTLKHVSQAFVEDPLRVLRVARFAARFAHLGFHVANETLQLMEEIVASGEMQELVPERVWQEMRKALLTQDPHVFFNVLAQVNALAALFPFTQGVAHEFSYLKRATSLSSEHHHIDTARIDIHFCAWCADHISEIMKREQPESDEAFQKRFKEILNGVATLPLPKSTQQLLITGLGQARVVPNTGTEAADDIALLNRCDAWRQPERLGIFITLWSAIFPPYEAHLEKLLRALPELLKVDVKAAIAEGLQGADIGKYVEHERIMRWQALK